MFSPGTKEKASKFPPISKGSSRDISNKSMAYRYSLSELTKKENKRVLIQAEQLTKKNNSFISHISPQSPANLNFDKLLDKLEVIISNKFTNSRQVQLEEGHLHEFIVEQGQVQYLRIVTRGKPSPLKVNINKQRGMIQTYISKYTPEPSEKHCDEVIKRNEFKIRSPGPCFEHDLLYLAVYPSMDSRFSISCSFGSESIMSRQRRNTPALTEVKKNNFEFTDKYEKTDRLEKYERIEKTHKFDKYERNDKSAPKVDYVKMNMVSPIESTNTLKKKYSKNLKKWDEKRKNAVAKKELIAKEKHESLVQMMHKRQTKHHEEVQRQALAKERSQLQFFQATFLSLAYIFKAADQFKQLLELSKYEQAVNKTSHKAARAIQTQFRSLVIPQGVKRHNLFKAHSFILLWANNFVTPVEKVSSFLTVMTRNLEIPLVFVNFERQVLMIQRTWRSHSIRIRIFWKKLVAKWGVVLGKLIERCDLSKKKSKKIKASEYFKITNHKRDLVLRNYLESRKEKFIHSLRTGQPSQTIRVIPTETQMIKIIKSVNL